MRRVLKTIDPSTKAAIIFSIICLTAIGISIIAFTLNIPKTPKDLCPNNVKFVPIAPHFPPLVHTHHFELSHDTFIALALELNITTVYHFYSGSDPKGTIYTFHMYLGSNVEVYFWTVYEGFLNDQENIQRSIEA